MACGDSECGGGCVEWVTGVVMSVGLVTVVVDCVRCMFTIYHGRGGTTWGPEREGTK